MECRYPQRSMARNMNVMFWLGVAAGGLGAMCAIGLVVLLFAPVSLHQ
jgi:hypothetical protein